MRTSLRRSCNACAKAKHSCDLGTPKCSRCLKRKVTCIYANVPLSSSSTTSSSATEQPARSRSIEKYEVKTYSLKSRDLDSASQDSMELFAPAGNSFDPFDSYPATRLPRVHVQRLIQHCKALSTKFQDGLISDSRTSSLKYLFSILPFGSQHVLKSIHRLLVAIGSCRSSIIPCFYTDGVIR